MKQFPKQKTSSLPDTLKNDEIPEMVAVKFQKPIQNVYNNNLALKKLNELTSEEEENQILDYLMKWKIYSGIINEPSEADYVIILDFIKECYPELNLYDIDQCMKMVSSNKLDVKKTASDESFASFSCSYVGRNLSAYKSWKKEQISDVNAEIRKQQLLLPSAEPTPEEKLTILKQLIIFSYNEIIEKEYAFTDFRSMVFDFLYRNKFIKMNENLINESLLFARTKLIEKKSESESKTLKNNFSGALKGLSILNQRLNSESSYQKQEKNYKSNYSKQDLINKAADYVVVKFFLKVENIDVFIEKLTIEHL